MPYSSCYGHPYEINLSCHPPKILIITIFVFITIKFSIFIIILILMKMLWSSKKTNHHDFRLFHQMQCRHDSGRQLLSFCTFPTSPNGSRWWLDDDGNEDEDDDVEVDNENFIDKMGMMTHWCCCRWWGSPQRLERRSEAALEILKSSRWPRQKSMSSTRSS